MGAYLCALLYIPCLHTEVGWCQLHTEGGRNSVLPALHIMQGGGHQQGLHKSGRGNANCVFAFPHPLFTPLFTCHIARKGRGCQQWVEEGGREGGVAVPLLPMHLRYMSCVCVVFHCLYFIIEIKRTQIKFKNWCLKSSG